MTRRILFRLFPALKREITTLQELNKDLKRQVTQLIEARRVDEDQWVDILRVSAEHRRQCEEIAQIGLFLRDRYAREIAEGRHAGRNWPEVVIGYLERERRGTAQRGHP